MGRAGHRYMLDTDTLTLLQRQHPVVVRAFQQVAAQDVLVSVISVEEQLSGWYTQLRRARSVEQLAEIYRRLTETIRVLGQFDLVTCSEAAIRRYQQLKKLKLGVGSWDLRIAAIALEEDAVLVTRNRRDFGLIPGLRCEDWSA